MSPETIAPPVQAKAPVKPFVSCWNWRGSHNSYRMAFRAEFAKLGITELVWVSQSESDGNVAITVFYR